MSTLHRCIRRACLQVGVWSFLVALLSPWVGARAQSPLRVVATTPDLASLCRTVGGDLVEVTSLVRGPEDPHFAQARPSMIRELSRADLLLEVGRELEVGWLPLLVDNSRNAAVQPGGRGRFRAADHVRVLGRPAGPVDRSHGDVHAEGNPHFLVDPLCGLEVAAALADRLAVLRPGAAAAVRERLQGLRADLARRMVGEVLAARYGFDAEGLARLFAAGRLEALLDERGDRKDLGGWFGLVAPFRGTAVVADHDLWPYFAERFGLRVVAFLEPLPGVAPTTRHLLEVAARMREQHVGVALASPYFPRQHLEAVRRAVPVQVAELAHQTGALPGCDDYAAFVDHDVRAVAAALAEAAK